MPWTQADVDQLKAAIATGQKSVSFADRRVEYASMDELTRALAIAQAEVNATAGVARPKQFLGFQSGKGI